MQLSHLRGLNVDLEQELLKAQEILNSNTSRSETLMIKEIETHRTHHLH
jgi:hypothetical protein